MKIKNLYIVIASTWLMYACGGGGGGGSALTSTSNTTLLNSVSGTVAAVITAN